MPVENQPAAVESQAAPANHEDAFSQALANQTATATEATGAQAQPEVSQPNFRDLFKDSGLQLDQFKSDEEFRDAILNERRQMAQYANLGQRFAPHAAAFDQFLQQQQAPPAQAAAKPADPNAWDQKKHFAEKWKVPEWNKQWDWLLNNGLVEIGDNGLYSPANGAEAIVAPHLAAMNEHRQMRAEQMNTLFSGNPFEAMYEAMLPAMERRMQAMFEESFGQRQGELQQQTALEQWEAQHAATLYTTDTAGNRTFTPAGQKLYAEAEALMAEGIADPVRALERAKAITGFQAAAPQPQLNQTPAQQSQQKVQSFIDRAKANSAHAPSTSALTPSNTPQVPVSADLQGELEQLFVNEYRAQMAGT